MYKLHSLHSLHSLVIGLGSRADDKGLLLSFVLFCNWDWSEMIRQKSGSSS